MEKLWNVQFPNYLWQSGVLNTCPPLELAKTTWIHLYHWFWPLCSLAGHAMSISQAKLRLAFRKVVVPFSNPCNRKAHAVITSGWNQQQNASKWFERHVLIHWSGSNLIELHHTSMGNLKEHVKFETACAKKLHHEGQGDVAAFQSKCHAPSLNLVARCPLHKQDNPAVCWGRSPWEQLLAQCPDKAWPPWRRTAPWMESWRCASFPTSSVWPGPGSSKSISDDRTKKNIFFSLSLPANGGLAQTTQISSHTCSWSAWYRRLSSSAPRSASPLFLLQRTSNEAIVLHPCQSGVQRSCSRTWSERHAKGPTWRHMVFSYRIQSLGSNIMYATFHCVVLVKAVHALQSRPSSNDVIP